MEKAVNAAYASVALTIFVGIALATPTNAETLGPKSTDNCTHIVTTQLKGCSFQKFYDCTKIEEAVYASEFYINGEITYLGFKNSNHVPLFEQYIPSDINSQSAAYEIRPELSESPLDDTRWAEGDNHYIGHAYEELLTGEFYRTVRKKARLVEETKKISGLLLNKYEFGTTTSYIGSQSILNGTSFNGEGWLSNDLNILFDGKITLLNPDGSIEEYDDTPIEIIRKGEDGFNTTQAKYDCN